jgi:phosphoribosylformylglycinamidine synthase subunit PurQ / glutaminase
MSVRVLVLRSAGINCDGETVHAFALAGARPELVHVNRVLEHPALLKEFAICVIPGGFSYGDDISAGRILAQQITSRLLEPLRRFVEAGGLLAGICNGFQVLVKTDLLPGRVEGTEHHPATLAHNHAPRPLPSRFTCRWVDLAAEASSPCVWTAGLGELSLPIAHGEGRFVPASDGVLTHLRKSGQIALRYTAGAMAAAAGVPGNPNGSTDDIAGVCDVTGRVFGMMPHPERCVRNEQNPAWGRLGLVGGGEGPGLRIFRNAVKAARA